MQVICARCSRVLDFTGDPPSFCAYCGQSLRDAALGTPPTHDANAPTLPAGPLPSGFDPAVLPAPIQGYRFLRKLGSGGMGGVFEAEELSSGRRVAVKLVAPQLTGSADTIERFRQEGRIASMVAHPRCVFVHAVDEDAGRPYIVMELMGGENLKDLVDRRGPLPPEEAIAKILDVIEGLQEAHKLEVIHRDVKPSNCFLEADGRVKVGDFGLAKSLVKDAHLTKTGAFVGTPYFASPEQVRGEGLDRQTDVYSVAATLYYLLAGQPPFWGSDSAATLARIVSDPPPSLRSVRPELSPALDRLVLRGLERDRKQRWQSLGDLKQALLLLTPGDLSLERQGLRLAAYLADLIIIFSFSLAVVRILGLALAPVLSWPTPNVAIVFSLILTAAFLSYFTLLEHVWGCSLGKRFFQLRVCSPRWIDPPAWGPAAVRTIVCFAGTQLPALAVLFFPSLVLFSLCLLCAGGLVLVWPMRARNHWRGLHELISGTRVAFHAHKRRDESLLTSGGWLLSLLQSRRLDRAASQTGPLPQRVGGFAVRGALKWSAGEKVLLGEDSAFGRRVFLWLRPQSAPSLDAVRRDIGRRTRLRWLASGKQGDMQWDAILAPSGCPLPDYVRSEGNLAWPEARALLQGLAGELSAACADGTLPRTLSVAQVWVQEGGQARLADTALGATEDDKGPPPGGTDQERSLALLRQVATMALHGQAPRPQETGGPARVALPGQAGVVIGRLLGIGAPYTAVDQLRNDLAALGEKPGAGFAKSSVG